MKINAKIIETIEPMSQPEYAWEADGRERPKITSTTRTTKTKKPSGVVTALMMDTLLGLAATLLGGGILVSALTPQLWHSKGWGGALTKERRVRVRSDDLTEATPAVGSSFLFYLVRLPGLIYDELCMGGIVRVVTFVFPSQHPYILHQRGKNANLYSAEDWQIKLKFQTNHAIR